MMNTSSPESKTNKRTDVLYEESQTYPEPCPGRVLHYVSDGRQYFCQRTAGWRYYLPNSDRF